LRGSLPTREWAEPEEDLDQRMLESVVNEIDDANHFLTFIDGHTTRTFTLPCIDNIVDGKVATKMADLDILRIPVYTPYNVSGEEHITYVKSAATEGTMTNLTFHGIGSDHLSLSTEAHVQLLAYLAKHQSIYWVDTYQNISTYVNHACIN